MKSKMLFGMLIGVLACAGTAMAVTYTDASTNYPGGSWTNGSNGGTGFEAWSILANPGSGAAEWGVWNSTTSGLSMGEAFGLSGRDGGTIDIDRDFAQALNTGDTFSIEFGVNYDAGTGNKGFNLYAGGVEVININNGGSDDITLNGNLALDNYGQQTMLWTFTQEAADQIAVQATGRDGSETYATTVTVANGYGYLGAIRFYSANISADFVEERKNYFDNLTLEQEGTPPPDPLSLAIGGEWAPETTGGYEYTLTRTGAVGDDIVLASDNTAALTVPAAATFAAGSNVLVFTGTVVSVTNGDAVITASNTATGVWAEYTIRPVAPFLEIDGEWQLYSLGAETYTLNRAGAVGDLIQLSSSDTGVMTVDASVSFDPLLDTTQFVATAVGTGTTTLTASNTASGVAATFDVTVSDPMLELTGPTNVWVGETETYTVTRYGPVDDTVNLSSTDTNVMTVPATVDFPVGVDTVTFQGVAVAIGATTLSADNADVDPATLDVAVVTAPNTLASDHAGNYTPATFINGANEGTGFLPWDLWNLPAALDDSTAGGGGDINSTNGYAFRFMGDAADGWCNGTRPFDGALQEDDMLTFTFTYNWDGGGRGVDLNCSTGQFANLINVAGGNTFQVNGTTISTEYSPGAVVEVEITQQAAGIAMSLVRSVAGVPNLTYATNILNAEPATSVSFYCGGYTDDPNNNTNYAIFVNDLTIYGDERAELNFTDGTWNPGAPGDYTYTLERSGAVTDDIVLSSTDEMVLTVPAAMAFETGVDTLVITATVVSVTNGNATIYASNTASGAWAEYIVYPSPAQPEIGDIVFDPVTGDFSFMLPVGYTLYSVEGADTALTAGDWVWVLLTESVDYTLSGNEVTILTDAAARKVIRIWVTDE